MSWLNVLAPLLTVVAIFIAYLGGKSAGRKETQIKQDKKEQEASDEVDHIISNNNILSADDIDNWLRSRAKK